MIELLLTILIELGLISADYRYERKVRKKEKEDGIQRPIQKYLLRPSIKVIFGFLFIVGLVPFLFFNYQKIYVYPVQTRNELAEISVHIEKWKDKFGVYPATLPDLIGNSPLRQSWDKDAWNRHYRYTPSENGKRFVLLSPGLDGIFETDDDIRLE